MRRPPEFIEVTDENHIELGRRCAREPYVRNGLMCAPCESEYLRTGDTIAFPWPDVITELGQLAEEAEAELAGAPLPAWPISRLRLKKGDILIARIGVPKSMLPDETSKYLDRCRSTLRETLTRAGYGDEVQVLAVMDNVEISVISGADEIYEAGP